jgi:nucleoside-diphosphate-sugar epimerase
MKVLVTGASGFIGSYLCQFLLQQGHQVIAVTRTLTDEMQSTLPNAEWMVGDVLDANFPQLTCSADAIIHLAAANDIISKNPNAGIELSVIGTRNLLQFAVNNKIPKFVFYSTLQVYGTELFNEVKDDAAIKCESDYGLNHFLAEEYVAFFNRKFGLQTAVVRPSNIYGPMTFSTVNRWTLVPGCFCKEIIEKQTITLLSSGNQYRNFISLQELSTATLSIIKELNAVHQVFNVASKHYFTIREVAEKVKNAYEKISGNAANIIVKSDQPIDSNKFVINLDNLYQTGFQSSVDSFEIDLEIEKLLKQLS